MTRLMTLSATALLLLMPSCSAKLRVDVSVYKGPVLGTPSSRLSAARGIAKNLCDAADRSSRDPRAFPNGGLFEDVAKSYKEMLGGFDRDSTGDGDEKLISGLIAYGKYCEVASQRKLAHQLLFGMIALPSTTAALVSLEENGRLISVLAESASRESDRKKEIQQSFDNLASTLRSLSTNPPDKGLSKADVSLVTRLIENIGKTRVASFHASVGDVMNSQSRGSAMIGIHNHPLVPGLIREYIRSTYSDRYWEPINPIEVSGTEKVDMMLVKDEAGNWHLKNVTNNPAMVIETAKSIADAAVSAALTIYGATPAVAVPAVPGG